MAIGEPYSINFDNDNPSEIGERLQAVVAAELDDARSYIEENLSEHRAKATRYYNGEPFGDEEPNRAQVVSRDVADTIRSMMPSIMRILFGSERPVEIEPRQMEDIALAEQATDYLNDVVIQQDNEGFKEVYAGVKDALIRKVGIWKWYWDDSTRLEVTSHSGLTPEALMALQDDETIEEIEVERQSEEGIQPELFKAIVHRRLGAESGRARFVAVPADEFLIDRNATSIKDATFVAHRTLKTVSELVAMGYDRDLVEEQASASGTELDTAERQARNPFQTSIGNTSLNTEARLLTYVEAYTYAKLSEEENDPAQLVKVCGVSGTKSFVIWHWEETDEKPFAAICPDPEPHAFFGSCPADDVMDIQRTKSLILRGTLDSLSLSIHPRYEAVDEKVNLMDLLNSEIGGVVRVDAPGMLREISLPFVGDKTLPMLDYMDRVKESRTKQSQASQGLDADALQSSTKAAVSATITAAQAHVELIARVFAETGYRDLFRGLYRLIVKHQDFKRTVRLRNQWVEIDPKVWDAEMDVRVNIALGAGTADEKIATLIGIAEKQEQLLAAAPENPMVGLSELRATYAKMAELAGWRNPTQFFKEVPEGTPGPPKEGAEGEGDEQAKNEAAIKAAEINAQVRMQELQMQDALEREKLAFEQQKAQAEMQLKQQEVELNAQIRIAVANAQLDSKLELKEIDALMEKMRVQQDYEARIATAAISARASVIGARNRKGE